MKRWHSEVALMQNRMKEEVKKHHLMDPTGDSFGFCECSKGLGTMRKWRPWSNSNHSRRWIKKHERALIRRKVKQRRQGRRRLGYDAECD